MSRFRKRPVVIEAWRFEGGWESAEPICAMSKAIFWVTDKFDETVGEIEIETLEGTMTAQPGDWIIKGVKGEFYPCKPDIFELTYEPCQDDETLTRTEGSTWNKTSKNLPCPPPHQIRGEDE